MTTTPTSVRPFVGTAEDARSIWHMGALMQFKVVGADCGGQYWLAEQHGVRGYSSPLHQHSREDELFVVLDGELTIHIDGQSHRLPTGAVSYAPRGYSHAFKIESATARFLICATPAGLEHWFFDTGTPAESLTTPPPPTGPPDIEALVTSLQAFGVAVVGPPPG